MIRPFTTVVPSALATLMLCQLAGAANGDLAASARFHSPKPSCRPGAPAGRSLTAVRMAWMC
jgi:hypothetical protein